MIYLVRVIVGIFGNSSHFNLGVQLGLDWWIEPSRMPGRTADVRVPPASLNYFHGVLNSSQITSFVLIQDVQALVPESLTSTLNVLLSLPLLTIKSIEHYCNVGGSAERRCGMGRECPF